MEADRGVPGTHRTNPSRRLPPVAAAVLKVLAALLSLALFVAFGYGWYSYRSLNQGTRRIAVAGLGNPSASVGASAGHGSSQNILIVGIDSRAGLTTAQKRAYHVGLNDQTTSTDTIMLVHVPADGKSATLVSIPRDTYVKIPGHPSNKINAAYADGYNYSGTQGDKARQSAGASELVATVHQLTGVTIDHYVEVGFAGFVDIVKAIGDIPINLCQSVDDTHSHDVAIGVGGGSGFKMSAGHHQLNPVQALEFVRQRHNIPGPITDDFGRELRQRYFLGAAFRKILSASVVLNPLKLRRLVKAVNGAFTFDQTSLNIEQFAQQMSDLSAGNIKGKSIPTTGSHNYGGVVGDALTVNPVAVARFVQHMFNDSNTQSRQPPAAAASTSGPRTGAAGTRSRAAHRSCVY
jgi:LCP family protein required for cell wall assembly